MQRQLYEYNKNQQIPVDSIIKIGESVLSFIVALFATKRSKDKRLDDLEITVKYILKKLENDNNFGI
ncbi:MAG: hypothetical protein EBR82_87515 [Caulobacteraceae bacterium]|nr:hypothetical protein [Caulobacteraceae bacterium]